ncbi:uncharacterized protein [Halyomorpha halys]|uniref:uncharacterized protein n=1 Tax=Halyomorpha halys TaxID=286706 RepID=UPI0006D50243|nr:uncharacterized protein LOC106686325 [Halyomorpha halys]
MPYLVRKRHKPANIRNIIKQGPKKRRRNALNKKQLKSPPDKRMKELLQDVMESISNMMYDGFDWVTERDILDDVLEKKDATEEEIKDAIQCGMLFGLIVKHTDLYCLPPKIYLLVEEGRMPDWTEYSEDWPDRPKKVKRVKKGRRKKQKRKRKS